MAATQEEQVLAKRAEMSAQASAIARYILLGIVALGYGIFSGDSPFAKGMLSQHPMILRSIMALAFAGIFLDFVQYNAGFRSADDACSNVDGGYLYKRKSLYYRLWTLSYIFKQCVVLIVSGLVLFLASIVMFTGVPQHESAKVSVTPFVRYVIFESGKKAVSSANFRMLDAVAKAAKSKQLKAVIVEGAADGVGDQDLNVKLAKARAKAVGAILKDGGVPPSKLHYRWHVAEKIGSIRPDPMDRATRVEILSD